MSDCFGMTVFCDDIRTEESGKHIYIGVYDAAMVVSQNFPNAIPTLAFAIKILEHRSLNEMPMRIIITAPSGEGIENDTIFDAQVPDDRWAVLDSQPEGEKSEYVITSAIVRLSPFRVNAEGQIRVRAYRGEQEIKLGVLRIEVPQGVPGTVY